MGNNNENTDKKEEDSNSSTSKKEDEPNKDIKPPDFFLISEGMINKTESSDLEELLKMIEKKDKLKKL